MDSTELALDRIAFAPEHPQLTPIPWPEGFAPEPQPTALSSRGGIPVCDVLVITWTAAEAMALADVLTPGVQSTDWTPYSHRWDAYEPQLTSRSPARSEGRLGSFHMTRIGTLDVCCFKSELHPATDADTLPAAQLAAQLAAESDAGLVITTGTAGGAGAGTLLGDVNVATAIHADFTTRLAHQPWSSREWATSPVSAAQSVFLGHAAELFAVNSHQLPKAPRQPEIVSGHVVSTDMFAFASRDDHFGLYAYDPQIRAVEMDDAAIAVGITSLSGAPLNLMSVRNASDPVMPNGSSADARQAQEIYRRYGYWTSINSAITCWALIAGLPSVN
jgi:nucleoside phosphorylase